MGIEFLILKVLLKLCKVVGATVWVVALNCVQILICWANFIMKDVLMKLMNKLIVLTNGLMKLIIIVNNLW